MAKLHALLILHGKSNIHLIPPVPYPELVWLMDRSTLIITDSGGIQEEAPSLGEPVIVTRNCTERREAFRKQVTGKGGIDVLNHWESRLVFCSGGRSHVHEEAALGQP